MTTIGIIGAGEVGCQIARAALASGYRVVIANSPGPETLAGLIAELGPAARAASAADAAAAGDFAVVAVPLKVVNDMPIDELAGKIVLDTNNYMVWRDGHIPVVDSGEKTIHELRQEQLPTSKVAKAPGSTEPRVRICRDRCAKDEDVSITVRKDLPQISIDLRPAHRLAHDAASA